jgi:cytochrome c-type biogenesis protein CcmH/NrfG
MMGWLLLVTMVAMAAAGLWTVGRVRGPALQLVAAGLCLAIAGYAWQGRPTLAGRPAVPARAEVEAETNAFADLRHAILGRFDRADSWLTIADSYLRRGDSRSAAGVLRSGIRAHPEDFDLWIGLGNILVIHADGALTPAAELAFARAESLAPGNPAPLFFRGLALASSGRFAEAEALWRRLLAEAPPGLSWRPLVEERLAILERIRAIVEGRAPPPPGFQAPSG